MNKEEKRLYLQKYRRENKDSIKEMKMKKNKTKKDIEDWKWGFLDKAPFLIEDDENCNDGFYKDVTKLKKNDLEYIYRAIDRLINKITETLIK